MRDILLCCEQYGISMNQCLQAYQVDLGEHLAECEANYLRLQKLMPDMPQVDRRVIGIRLPGKCGEVSLTVIERAPYTTILTLTQCKPVWGESAPEMTIRIYHDAQMAEVAACQQVRARRARNEYPNPAMLHKDEKRQWNRLLGEWLAACLAHGHVVQPVAQEAGGLG